MGSLGNLYNEKHFSQKKFQLHLTKLSAKLTVPLFRFCNSRPKFAQSHTGNKFSQRDKPWLALVMGIAEKKNEHLFFLPNSHSHIFRKQQAKQREFRAPKTTMLIIIQLARTKRDVGTSFTDR